MPHGPSSEPSLEYLKTHPWITFRVDLSRLPFEVWMNLGAIQSKCRHVADSLVPPHVAEKLLELYVVKGVQATTAIEGNTMSEDEVRDVLRGAAVPRSKEYLAREVRNVVAAFNAIGTRMLAGESGRLSVELTKEFNKLVLDGLAVDDGIVPGEVSLHNVVVGAAYRGAPRRDCEFLLSRLCTWINDMSAPGPHMEVAFAVIKAVISHLYLAWIHPFGDGNGRTARLIELHLLLAAGVPTIVGHLLSNHYNQTRDEYYRQLTYASKSNGDVTRFLAYAVQGLVDGMDVQIQAINSYQWEATWKDFVFTAFRGKHGAAADRRRQVALDLWNAGLNGVDVSKVRTLSPRVAGLYGERTDRAAARDLSALEAMNLVERDASNVRINFKPLFAFVPTRKA